MNRATLQDREEWFIERLNEKGNFEYIGGYTTMKNNVILKHKKCGKTVMQRAYTVVYSDIDECYECSRHRRGYDSIKENIKHSDTLGIVGRKIFGTRYRYHVKCRVCGEEYYFNKNQLNNGIVCCSGTTSRMERIVKSKTKEVVRKLKATTKTINDKSLKKVIEESFNELSLLRSCIYNTDKLFTNIYDEVKKELNKKTIGHCPICNEKVIKKSDWRIDYSHNKRKICKNCRKSQKLAKNVSKS